MKAERNYVAKHMNTFNHATIELDKRNKILDDLYEKELGKELEQDIDEELNNAQLDS